MKGRLSWAILAVLMVGFCACTPKSGAETGGQDTVAVKTKSAESATPQAAPSGLDDSWETLGNNEMVMYCLPYPKAEFKEDFNESHGKAVHFLKAIDQSGSIVFAAELSESSLDEQFTTLVTDVEMISGNAPIRKQKHKDGFEVVWEEKGQHRAIRRWVRESEGETVTADFTYDPAHAGLYEKWFKKISEQTSICE